MNELTKQLQEIMVPKAALIAYEYQEGHYASGSHYLELRPINKKGRMEAGIPVTYEFMDSLVESYSDGNRRIPHGWLPPNMLWCDTRRGHESYVWYNPPGKRRMFFKNLRLQGEKTGREDTALSGPFFQRDRWKRMPGKLHTGETGEPGFSHPVGILGETFLAQ